MSPLAVAIGEDPAGEDEERERDVARSVTSEGRREMAVGGRRIMALFLGDGVILWVRCGMDAEVRRTACDGEVDTGTREG